MHRRQLMLETLCQAKGVISPSRFLAKRMMDWGLPRDRIEVIDNGVKLENAGRASGEPQPKRRRIFGYFGQITPFKGLDVLLDAAEILARSPASTENIGIRIHGNLVGVSGEFRERFENLVKSLPILEYTGAYSNDDVHKLMCECDYVVIPSVWWENSPLVIQEAFAAKCPVICTGIGGLQEKIEHGRTGFHFRRGDASDLARTITEAMGDGVLETLRSGLPAPRDPLTMARDYLAAFERFAQRESCSSGKPN